MGKIIHNGVQITREINVRNILSTYTNTSQTTSTTNPEKIPMVYTDVVGTKLTKTDEGGIKIGNGISYVKVSASIMFSDISGTNDRHHILIYKNGTNQSNATYRLSGSWVSINIQPKLVPVSANDVIYLYVRSQDNSGAVVDSAAMLVEAVE